MQTENALSKSISYLALLTGTLLLIPLAAMQFTDEVTWSLSDFILAGILIFGTGMSYLLITRKSAQLAYRVAVGLGLFAGLFLILANLAVGIIGSEDNLINLWYFGVILAGIAGSLLVRFHPKGMAFTMLAMILAQASVTLAAINKGMHLEPFSPLVEILGINALFIVLFAILGLLFWYSDVISSNNNQDGVRS